MPLSLYRRNGFWHYRGSVAGRRIRGSCKTKDKAIASREASQVEAREWKRRHDGPGSVLTFAQAATHYRAAGKSDKFLANMEDRLKDMLVQDITPGYLRSLAIEMFNGCSGATMNRHALTPVLAVINLCAKDGKCSPLKVERFKTEHKIKEPATVEWVKAFVANANPNIGAMCMFMFMTGARIGEAVALRWEDVNLEKRTALIRQTKVGAERVANLPMPLVVAIANLKRIEDRGVFGYVHPDDTWRVWEAAIKAAKIKHLSPHCCRHGFATTLIQRGVDVVTVARLGGWKTAAIVLKTYAHAKQDPTITDILAQSEHSETGSADKSLVVIDNSK
jgi:integrase